MRRLLPFILTLLALSALAGCASKAAPMLDRAEEAMEPHPDSALSILQAIRTTDLMGDDERARYALLLTQAMDKNYIDVSDDSLIAVADSYYRRASDPRRRMLAAFYHGRVRFNASDYPRALQLFSESLDLASALPDTFWMARSASEISYIYQRVNHNAEELHYTEIALDYYRRLNIQPYLDYALYEYAVALINSNHNLQARDTLATAIESFYRHGNSNLAQSATGSLAKAYINTGDCLHGIQLLESLLQKTDANNSDLYQLAFALIADNKTEEAVSLVPDQPKNPIERLQYMDLKRRLAAASGNYNEAYDILTNAIELNDSLLHQSLNTSLTLTLDEYRRYEKQQHEAEMHNAELSRFIILFFAITAVTSITALFIKFYRMQQQTIRNQLSIADNLKEILALKTTEFSEAQKHIAGLLASRFKEIDALLSTYYSNLSVKSSEKKIAEKVTDIICDLSKEDERIAELETLLNRHHNNILTTFKNEIPRYKREDYMLFLYSALGFSTNAIALLLDENDVRTIYNRKRRLKDKIKALDTPDKTHLLAALA